MDDHLQRRASVELGMYRFHARDAAAIARLVAIEALFIGLLLAAFVA